MEVTIECFPNFRRLADEHRVVLGHVGAMQRRCSELVASQAAEVESLEGEVMRLRAQLMKAVLCVGREQSGASFARRRGG